MKKLLVFMLSIWRRFQQAGGTDSAATLAYATLLNIVPLFALAISVLSVSDWFAQWQAEVVHFLMGMISPDSLRKVEQALLAFAEQASKLKGPSIVGLLITVLFLLDRIYRKIADIWVEQPRAKLWVRILHYLGVSLLGPVLIGLSFWLSGFLAALPLLAHWGVLAPVKAQALKAAPVVMVFVGFYLLYRYAPPVPIRKRAALVGAALATAGLQMLKAGFALYVQWFPNYQLIYGALAAIPLFLVWLYLLWAMVLLVAAVVWRLDFLLRAGQKHAQSERTKGEKS